MKEYLDMRFDVRLLSVPSSRIVSVIGERTSGLLDDKVSEELSVIASFFIRTDYMRYAQGSLDSFMLPVEEHRTEFLKGERKEIVKKSIAFINIVESQKEETEK